MRYMLLVYSTEVDPSLVAPEEMERIAAGHRELIAEAGKRGVLVAAEPLKATSSATTVRHRGGKLLTLDGPFAETKEQLAGFYLLDCADLDEAIAWAARIPTACAGADGCIEIRPLRVQPEDAARVA